MSISKNEAKEKANKNSDRICLQKVNNARIHMKQSQKCSFLISPFANSFNFRVTYMFP